MTPPAIIIGLAIIGIADARTGWEITKYVLTGCFERVPDKKVVSLGRLLRYYMWFYLITFMTLVFVFFYSLFT